MDPIRPLRPIVKLLMFPLACIACVLWIAGFVMIFRSLPNHNLGIGLLVALAGIAVMIPWMAFVVGIYQRMHPKQVLAPAGAPLPPNDRDATDGTNRT
jgi:hypothetical protein